MLPAFVGRFRLLHDEVKVTLHIGDTRQVAEAVLAGELEAGVVGALLEDERLAFTPLMDDEVALAGWPGHPYGPSLEPKDLKQVPVVYREPGSGTRMFLSHALKKAGLDPSDMNIVAQMGSTMAVLQAVRAQVGLGFLSHRAMVEELEAGRLVEVKLAKVSLRRQFYLVTRKKRTHSPAAPGLHGPVPGRPGRRVAALSLSVDIPGWQRLELEHLVLDLNGTLALDGALLPGVASAVESLTTCLTCHLVTADTFGTAAGLLGPKVAVERIVAGDEIGQKRAIVERLGAPGVAALGNGANDAAMLAVAGLGIAVLGPEGAAAAALSAADVVAPGPLEALGLLLHPDRLRATLRR